MAKNHWLNSCLTLPLLFSCLASLQSSWITAINASNLNPYDSAYKIPKLFFLLKYKRSHSHFFRLLFSYLQVFLVLSRYILNLDFQPSDIQINKQNNKDIYHMKEQQQQALQKELAPTKNTEKTAKQLLYSRQQYGTKQFWESRYKQNEKTYFDWYAEYPELKETLEGQYCIQKTNSILMLGCGNSKLSDQMYEAGYQDILNIDISPSVIQQMKSASIAKGYDLSKIKWETMDATNMQSIPDHSIDVLIDKGTLDALISGGNMDICVTMLKQSMRVMNKDGQFIMITYASPEGRKRFFQAAIGFDNYDYYATKVDLSTQSTLINLMRSNLGKKPLSSITQDPVAMKQSMLEFNLIKVLRRNRKNEKKYIVWGNYEKKEEKINLSDFQDKKIQPASTSTEETATTASTNNIKKENDEPVYNPMKQCFCYVYSIKHKFASDLDQIVPSTLQEKQLIPARCEISEGVITLPGDSELKSIGVYVQEDAYLEVLRALSFLDKCGISNNPVAVYTDKQKYLEKKENYSVKVETSSQNYAHLYSKTLLEVTLPVFNGNMTNVQKLITKSCEEFVEEGGLRIHPEPRNYGFLGIIMQKLGKASSGISKFLNKYWYPTWVIKQTNLDEKIATYLISVPPSMEISFYRNILIKNCRIKEEWANVLKEGTLNELEPRIFGIMHMCTVTFCEGKSFALQVEEFQNSSNQELPKEPTLSLRKEILAKSMARLFSSL